MRLESKQNNTKTYLTDTTKPTKLRPGLVASYDSEQETDWVCSGTKKHNTHIFAYLLTFPGPTQGPKPVGCYRNRN